METLNQYLDAALKRMDFSNDADLSRAMQKSTAAVSHWRTGRSLPDDNAMMLIADFAGVDQSEALLRLNIWRSSASAGLLYKNLLQKISGTLEKISGTLAAFYCVLFLSSPAQAAQNYAQAVNDAGTLNHNNFVTIHYQTVLRAWRRFWARLTPCFN